MGERDSELDEILAGIGDLLAGKQVVDPIDKEASSQLVDDICSAEKRSFLRKFIVMHALAIGDNEPDEIAPVVKRTFAERIRLRFDELALDDKHGLAEFINELTLDDLVEVIVNDIDQMEHQLAKFKSGSYQYRTIELNIRRYDKLQMGVRLAMDL